MSVYIKTPVDQASMSSGFKSKAPIGPELLKMGVTEEQAF